MNIILVSDPRKAPRGIDLRHPRQRMLALGALAAVALTLVALGMALSWLVYSPRDHALAEVRALRAQLSAQQAEIGSVQRGSQRDLNALAVKLGQLEAQSLRLGALGERLARAGKLDGGEFNFDAGPALGGPEVPLQQAGALPQDIDRGLTALRLRFDAQQSQLGLLERLLLDRKVDAAAQPSGMPVVNGFIDSYYGPRTDPFTGGHEFHTGLDIDASAGTPITSVARGIVSFAGVRNGYGNVVEVDHGNGYLTRYAHAEKLLVHVGETVRTGQVLALVGSTGRSTGPHVHFEVWYRGKVINPLAFVQARHRL
ncbi:MAG: M23 family metallopeptidase [Metallibacterium scheffleri]|jgi:murein DD-endopeptidase MepM/ murein hydrolase activator NlpD|uniref:M23 family metallopeptidase n=1 Tax=Metallibacterium scheffleri TaxID=993689 RepID=UPI0026E92C25|nr:M23 family metallopeptidase [Metallibacterium scheffleri]MCK9366141.1 M23 family metallopeptidase [Metallibacterium scheffleri]